MTSDAGGTRELRERLQADLSVLSEAAGVSGLEDEVRTRIAERVRPFADRLETDSLGNLIATRYARREGRALALDAAPVVMVAAHMDEVGLLVSHVEQDGTLRFKVAGGIDARVLVGKKVRFMGSGRIGVIGPKPIHLQKEDERFRAEEASGLSIDIGALSREEAERCVKPGDGVTFTTPFAMLSERRAVGKAFDDRIGCAVLIQLLQQEYPVTLAAAFTVQEEVGARGAQVAAFRINPKIALVLEGTTCADVPGSEAHEEATRLGAGPALSVMDQTSIASPRIVRRLARVAESHGIPFQWRRTAAGGNDAGPIHTSRGGVSAASVSVPCRYIHAPAGIVDLDDAANAVRLVAAFLKELDELNAAVPTS